MSTEDPNAELEAPCGDPPCWAHLFDDDPCQPADPPGIEIATSEPVVVDLGSAGAGSGGAVWSLPHGGDLDANLVRIDAGAGIGEHVNNDVDVLLFVLNGSARLIIDGIERQLGREHLVLIPKAASRSVTAGPSGITYLSVHRRRSALGIARAT